MAMRLNIRKQALGEMLEIGDKHTETITENIKRAAQQSAPVQSGELKASHGTKKMRRGLWIVTIDKFYAAWVHWGRKKYQDEGQPWVLKAAKSVGITTRGK